MVSNLALVRAALREYGQVEIKGLAANPRIGAYLSSVGLPPVDETSWCSAFMHFCAAEALLERPPVEKAPAARSWLDVGEAVTEPDVGDVVVFSRGDASGWQAHVALFVAFGGGGKLVYALGGNQHDSVNISAFETGKVLGYRRLAPA